MSLGLLLASAVSGCVSRTFVHPLDTIRSLLMVSTSNTTTFSSVARDLIKRDGIPGLYRGFGISVTMQAPAIATFLSTYDCAKLYLSQYEQYSPTLLSVKSPFVHLMSGLVAETVSAVFWVPMEVIKQRAQVRRGAMSSASSIIILRDLLRHEGPMALFKGYTLTIGVFGPYSMLYFMAYERLKSSAANFIQSKQQNQTNIHTTTSSLPTPVVAASAASAGAFAAACTTPLDVVKTRIQTQGDIATRMGTATQTGTHRNNTTWSAARGILVQDGIRGFFRGLSARVLWIMPSTAITMSTFEFLKSYFQLAPKITTASITTSPTSPSTKQTTSQT